MAVDALAPRVVRSSFFPLFLYLGYPKELSNALKGQLDISALQDLEDSMCRPFHNPDPNRNWREGVSKTSMNYLLLDPRITHNLPNRVKTIGNCESSLNPLHTGRCGSNFKIWYSNSLDMIIAWALTVKLLSCEYRRTSRTRSQHWFR